MIAISSTSRRLVVVAVAAVLAITSGVSHASSGEPAAPLRTRDDRLAAVSALAPEFAGIYLDADGQTHLQLTSPTEEARRRAGDALVEVFGPDLPGGPRGAAIDTAVLHRADHGFGALKQWYDRMLSVLSLRGVVLTDIDERANRLQVGIAAADGERAVRGELGRLGVPNEVVEIAVVPEVTPHTLQSGHTPKVGGIQISNGNGGICTLGFNARRANVAGFVTNSHCTNVRGGVENTLFWQPAKPASCSPLCLAPASETADPAFFDSSDLPIICPIGKLCRLSDAAFAKYLIDSPNLFTAGRIARPAANDTIAWNGSSTFRVVDEWDALLFLPVTKVGRTTGKTSGVVVNTCANVNVKNTNITMLCQDSATYDSWFGDSGSPVFYADGTDASLVGINWGAGGNAWFSPISNVENELGALSTCASGFSC